MNHRKSACLLFRWLRPHHFLVLMVTSVFLSFVLGYTISVALDKVHPLFPYISDTGTTVPASCYFGFCLSLAALFIGVTVYYMHAFLEKQLTQQQDSRRHHIINDVASFMGFLSALGIMVVANFQILNVFSVHMFGAFLALVIGNVYMYLHTYLTSITNINANSSPPIRDKCKFITRLLLSVIVSVGVLMTFIGARVSNQKTSILHYDDAIPGYKAHLVSTFGEFVAGVCVEIFFLTYLQDFKRIKRNEKEQTSTTTEIV